MSARQKNSNFAGLPLFYSYFFLNFINIIFLCFFSNLCPDPSAPPTFTDTPPQYVEAKEGGSITLTCTAFGNPKPSVSWLREGSLMVSSAKYKVCIVYCYHVMMLL